MDAKGIYRMEKNSAQWFRQRHITGLLVGDGQHHPEEAQPWHPLAL